MLTATRFWRQILTRIPLCISCTVWPTCPTVRPPTRTVTANPVTARTATAAAKVTAVRIIANWVPRSVRLCTRLRRLVTPSSIHLPVIWSAKATERMRSVWTTSAVTNLSVMTVVAVVPSPATVARSFRQSARLLRQTTVPVPAGVLPGNPAVPNV